MRDLVHIVAIWKILTCHFVLKRGKLGKTFMNLRENKYFVVNRMWKNWIHMLYKIFFCFHFFLVINSLKLWTKVVSEAFTICIWHILLFLLVLPNYPCTEVFSPSLAVLCYQLIFCSSNSILCKRRAVVLIYNCSPSLLIFGLLPSSSILQTHRVFLIATQLVLSINY